MIVAASPGEPATATNGSSNGTATDTAHAVGVPVAGDEDVSRN